MLWWQLYPDTQQQDWLDSIRNLGRRHKRRKEHHFQLFDNMMKLGKKNYCNSNKDYIYKLSYLVEWFKFSVIFFIWANSFFHKTERMGPNKVSNIDIVWSIFTDAL